MHLRMYVNSRKLRGRSRSTKQRLSLLYKPTNMTEEFLRPTRSLVGRVAIVSGAGAAGDGIGNGRASAILLAEAGSNVVCVDMKHDLAQRTAELVEQDGHGKAIAVQADVTSEDDARNVVSKTLDAFGRIDILVNVVGIGGAVGTAEEVDMVEWAKGMEVNVASMVIMAKYCIPHMADNEGQWRGSIVNIASVAGIRGGTPHLLYPTSKGAIVVSCVSSYLSQWTDRL
jgi:NAD(P)-dependent dehydrogenase (short-subunit alcohol dehydrogenase family)